MEAFSKFERVAKMFISIYFLYVLLACIYFLCVFPIFHPSNATMESRARSFIADKNNGLKVFKNKMAQSHAAIDYAYITEFGYVDGRTGKKYGDPGTFFSFSRRSFLNHTDIVPASLENSCGFIFTLHRHNIRPFIVPILIQSIHPPITDPLTGEVVTTEEWPTYALYTQGILHWNFKSERELVPGPWIFKVIYKDRVLAEKTFHMAAVKDKYQTGLAKQIPQFRIRIAQNPKDAELIKSFGNLYARIGDYEEAIVQFKKAISLNPHPNYFNNECGAYNSLDKYGPALEACDKALELNPQHTSALINRGNTYRSNKEYGKAIDDLTHALKVVPAGDNYNPPIAYYNRALTYEEIGKYDQAFDDDRRAIAISPHFPEANYELINITKKISLGKRLSLLKTDPVSLPMVILLFLGLCCIFSPRKMIELKNNYWQKSPTTTSNDLENEVHKTQKIGRAVVVFVFLTVLYICIL